MDPSNAPTEARIIRHLLRERLEQCAGRPTHEAAMDAAGPIIAPRGPAMTSPAEIAAQNAALDDRDSECRRNKDEPADS